MGKINLPSDEIFSSSDENSREFSEQIFDKLFFLNFRLTVQPFSYLYNFIFQNVWYRVSTFISLRKCSQIFAKEKIFLIVGKLATIYLLKFEALKLQT